MARSDTEVAATVRLKCYVHCEPEERGEVFPFTRRRWETFLSCGKKWLELDGRQRLVAEGNLQLLTTKSTGDIPADAGYHNVCYTRFVDKGRIDRASKRNGQGAGLNIIPSTPGVPGGSRATELGEPSPKRLRSTTTVSSRRRSSVLPKLCIICKKVNKYITSGDKRVQDKLHQADQTAGCALDPIENGEYDVEVSDVSMGQVVRVVCSLGYKLIGPGYHVCDEATGKLTNGISTCVGCPLEPLENGNYLDMSDSRVGVAVQAICHSGYKLAGTGYHVCNLTSMNFTSELSTCEDINECANPYDDGSEKGPCDVNAYCLNTIGSFFCICKKNYEWTETYCKFYADCPALSAPDKGKVTVLFSKTARYECDSGLVLYGPKFRHCRNGRWTGIDPVCRQRVGSCPIPEQVTNGYIGGKDFRRGDMIRYFCEKGYSLKGPKIRNCTQSLIWTGYTPICEKSSPMSIKEIAKTLTDKLTVISTGSSTGRLHRGGADGADVVFMIDRSSSIKPSSLKRVKEFIMTIIHELGVDNSKHKGDGTRIAVLTFGTEVDILFNLDNTTITSPKEVQKALNTIKPFGGETALRPAVERMYLKIAKITRPRAQKAVFLIADGQSTIDTRLDTTHFLERLKDKRYYGFEIFVIGVGPNIMAEELIRYASSPSRRYLFHLDDFRDLTRLIERVVLDKNNPTCGMAGKIKTKHERTSAIMKAEEGSWPWLSLIYDERVGMFSLCGGALICKNWLITSAKCVEGNQSSVELGVHELTNRRNVKSLIPKAVHVYNDTEMYDVALVEFHDDDTNDMLSSLIHPICIPAEEPGRIWVNNKEPWVAGRGAQPARENGKHTIPRNVSVYTKLPRQDGLKCSKAFPNRSLADSHFCAGFESFHETDCRGDIGGPIMYQDNGRFWLMGIAQETEHCNERGLYGLFTDTLNQDILDWIHSTTSQCNIFLQDNIILHETDNPHNN